MITLVKLQRKGQMTLPSRLREALGVEEGDMIEATLEAGKVVLTPKVLVNRSDFPSADSDYTPAQRRVIDARLKEAEADIKARRVHGPFDTHKEMMAFLTKGISKGSNTKTNRSKK